jgi:hypothetical protein
MKGCIRVAIGAIVVVMVCQASGVLADENAAFIDLAPKMNRKLTDNLGSGRAGNSLSTLPTGQQTLENVKFKIGPGVVQLASKVLDSWPDKVEGIAVDRKFAKLHILHATCFGGGLNREGDDGYVKDGTLIGQYIVNYDDGSSEGIPIVYGEDVRDFWYVDNEKVPSRGRVAWKGENAAASNFGAHVRLYASSWTNPKPDQKVVRIDYVSRKSETPAAPFCLAMSVDEK